jgi:hypothetical protein
MTKMNDAMSAQMKALKTTDLSPFIRMGGLVMPRILTVFLETLNKKQRGAFDKAMPVGGQKKFYTQLVGTPTPPIVIGLAQPLQMTLMTENEVKEQHLKGIRLTLEDLQLISERKIGKALWRLKGQLGTMLGLSGIAAPFIQLGPRELIDLKNKAMTHFKPMIDLMPH